ncbi:hypothetical protein JW848_06470 [Candidatus Bipolaricaulota bacterium]|nr:hypothetical protein [Candidatus Bipolaricaulota bacterium]
MSTWLIVTLTVVGTLVAGAGLVLWGGASRWQSESADLQAALTEAARQVDAAPVDFAELERAGLPDPVLRYFRWALSDGQPRIRTARIAQQGQFLLGTGDGGWVPFTAVQFFSAQPPGFVWDAAMKMAPLVSVRVRDAYAASRGGMLAKVLSVVTVMDERGRSELDEGALQRFLAEAVWQPTALLPSEHLAWSAIDDDTALATLTDPRSGTCVSMEFRFGDQGEIVGIFTPGRYREVDGEYVLAPWAGSFWSYEKHDGMMIPMEGEVEWQLSEGPAPYWEGRLVDVRYDFAP